MAGRSSISAPLCVLEPLLEVEDAAVELVDEVEGALLIAPGGQPQRAPPARGRLVAGRLELHHPGEPRAARLEHGGAAEHLLHELGGGALPRIEHLLPELPGGHRRPPPYRGGYRPRGLNQYWRFLQCSNRESK